MLVAAWPAWGAWRVQEVNLHPGWNSVFLQMQPEPDVPETVFDGIPIRSVWAWNRRYSPVQFVQDASTLVPKQPEWLSYFPPAGGEPNVSTLFAIRGGQAYLIRLGGTQNVTWRVAGRVVVPKTEWVGESYNLVGLPVDPANPATFQGMLGSSSAHTPVDAYRLSPQGQWVKIASPNTERAQAGEAYWVYAKGPSRYAGPLTVTLDQAGQIDFGRVLNEQVIRIKNETAAAKQVRLRPTASDDAPEGNAAVAGVVPLSSWNTSTLRWDDFPASLSRTVPAQGELSLRLAVRRPDMAPSGDPTAVYQSVLEVTDGAGTRFDVPVSARGMDSVQASAGLSAAGQIVSGTSDPRAGLWVGTARIDRVSQAGAANPSQRPTPTSTASEFTIRLIVHVDSDGRARLLQNVTLMRKEGTTKPDPADPSKTVVDEPGHQVLITRQDLLSSPQFSGAALRDGQLTGRRISSAAFGFRDPVLMTGSFDQSLSSGPMKLAYTDPLNPFQHRYHPDHDNLGYDFRTPVPEGVESYDVVRSLELRFSATDPEGLQLAGWGDTQVGGEYRESITGLHREVLYVAGSFRLDHVSRVALLNDGM